MSRALTVFPVTAHFTRHLLLNPKHQGGAAAVPSLAETLSFNIGSVWYAEADETRIASKREREGEG